MRSATAVAGSTILGAVLGGALGLAIAGGYLTGWHRLASTDRPAVGLVVDASYRILVELDGGETVACARDGCSEVPFKGPPEPCPGNTVRCNAVMQPCARHGAPFSVFADVPSDVRDCVAVNRFFADGQSREVVALVADGSLWAWIHTSYALDGMMAILVAFGGASVGWTLSVAAAIGRRRRAERIAARA
jgi:hypothetical protein